MICNRCKSADHFHCPAVYKGQPTLCDCQHMSEKLVQQEVKK